MCSYVYGTFLTKFQPERSYSTCSFMRVFNVWLGLHEQRSGIGRVRLAFFHTSRGTLQLTLKGLHEDARLDSWGEGKSKRAKKSSRFFPLFSRARRGKRRLTIFKLFALAVNFK